MEHNLSQGLLYRWTVHSGGKNLNYVSWGDGQLGTQITPWGWIIGPRYFIILKKSYQDLYNERSNLILSSLKVGYLFKYFKHRHFLTNYMKLQILAPYNNLRIGQDFKFAKF